MRLSAPKFIVWFIALVLGVLGIVANFIAIPFVSSYVFWFLTVGFVLLILGTSLKGF